MDNAQDLQLGIAKEDGLRSAGLELAERATMLIKAGWGSDLEIIMALEAFCEHGKFADKCTITHRAIDAAIAEARHRLDSCGRGKSIRPLQLIDDVNRFYEKGYDGGIAVLPWPTFSQHLRIAKREMTIVTGIPGHGKSEFVDALMMFLVGCANWRIAFFSPENFPYEIHLEKLMTKLKGAPFHNGNTRRMDKNEVSDAVNMLDSNFVFIEPDEDDISLDSILTIASREQKSNGLDVLVIDPWNEIEHNRSKNETETEYIGKSLMQCRRFARKHNLALFIVAHPQKLIRDKDGNRPVPTPYDISGSSHWFNKADNCITVFRQTDCVEVHVQKVKFKLRGKPGMVIFTYDKVTGRYTEK